MLDTRLLHYFLVVAREQNMTSDRRFFTPDSKKQRIVGSYNLITNATYMVEQGLSYALCLADLVNTEGRSLRFIPIVTDHKTESYIVTKKYAYFSKAAKLLLQNLMESFVDKRSDDTKHL